MADNDVIAAILPAVLTAYRRTGAEDMAAPVETCHAWLAALQHRGAARAGTRWSVSAEACCLAEDSGRKP
jgi:hypothetical protein